MEREKIQTGTRALSTRNPRLLTSNISEINTRVTRDRHLFFIFEFLALHLRYEPSRWYVPRCQQVQTRRVRTARLNAEP